MLPWTHGARYNPETETTTFRLWAPLAKHARVHVTGRTPAEEHDMQPAGAGYWEVDLANCAPGTRYLLSVDDLEPRPDPASRSQPDGVHKPSAVADTAFPWTDKNWRSIPLEQYVIYELHIGTFTEAGTFQSAIEQLPRLKELGITAVEVMPIAQFPGKRNWGYDGVYLYAAAESYGGLHGFKQFVNAAHALGLAVVLDVVYNHLGPEGNYLSQFGPYFNENYHTPWGAGLNFDAAWSDGVRDFFIGNATFWMEVCHVDALRLDAVHAIIDASAWPFLRQLSEEVHALGRRLHKRFYVIGENDRNDPAFTEPVNVGGIGADSQWSDDFHHALHAILTGERHGYFEDFGDVSQLAKAYTDGFVYDGIYSAHRKCHHGADSRQQEGWRFVACSQNHDQVGNRPDGTRMSMTVDLPRLKMAAVALLGSPFIPLLFMGEEFAVKTPFYYFVDHSDPALVEGVRRGRAEEFREFFATGTPVDPQAESTFLASKIRPDSSAESAAITRIYKRLLELRRSVPALGALDKRHTWARAHDARKRLIIRREHGPSKALLFFNFADEEQRLTMPAEKSRWNIVLHTESPDYLGHCAYEPAVQCDGELQLTLPPTSAAILVLNSSTSPTGYLSQNRRSNHPRPHDWTS